MTFDAKVPASLKKEQLWFAGIIGRPIDQENRMMPLSPQGVSMEMDAQEHISPSPTLQPAQRIQIYNQQYWWRLFKTLQESFPILTRLFGEFRFNYKLATPYLVKYPPSHWSLNLLGENLTKWLKESYREKDKALVVDAAHVDWAFSQSFLSEQLQPLTAEHLTGDGEEILGQKLYTQPHLHLFCMPHHLFNFRSELVKHPVEYWRQNDYPILQNDKIYFFALYRNLRNEISWKELSEGEYRLLLLFQRGISVEGACDWLEKQQAKLFEAAMQNLQNWFQEWTQRGWLTLQPRLPTKP